MKQSTRYLQIKVVVYHDDDTNPNDVINECDYTFRAQTGSASIRNTEIQEISETPWE